MYQGTGATLKINDDLANYARKISSNMSSPIVRKRGLIELLGVACAKNYLSLCGFRVSTSKSLHNIAQIHEDFKINDIYVSNYRIDVITQYKNSKIEIPKLHKDFSCMPDFYLVVKLGSRLKEAKVVGYISTQELSHLRPQGDYLIVDDVYLKSVNMLHMELKNFGGKKTPQGKHSECVSLFLRYIDKELSTQNKKVLIQHLINCPSCAMRLMDTIEFNRNLNSISNIKDLIYKNTSSSYTKEQSNYSKSSSDTYGYAPKTKIDLNDSARRYENIAQNTKPQNAIIDNIFDGKMKIEPNKIISMIGDNKKKMSLLSFIVIGFLGLSLLIAFKSSDTDISSIKDIDTPKESEQFDSKAQEDFAASHSMPKDIAKNLKGGNDYSIVTQPTGDPLVATINKVSWEVSENLANKDSYTRFLQLVGKNIKLNLQNDLLLSSDFAKNGEIKINIKIASDGDIIGMKIVKSSGTNAIDEIIKKSVTETLSFMKPPSSGLMARPNEVTLIINL